MNDWYSISYTEINRLGKTVKNKWYCAGIDLHELIAELSPKHKNLVVRTVDIKCHHQGCANEPQYFVKYSSPKLRTGYLVTCIDHLEEVMDYACKQFYNVHFEKCKEHTVYHEVSW